MLGFWVWMWEGRQGRQGRRTFVDVREVGAEAGDGFEDRLSGLVS